MKALIALFVLVLVAATSTIYFSRPKVPRPAAPSPAASGSALPKVDPMLATTGLSCSGGKCEIELTVRIEGVCHIGDLNYIMVDLTKASAEPKARLSLEPLLRGESAFPPLTAEVSLSELQAGLTRKFTLPPFQKPTQLGVFVCKDSKKEGSCAGKEFLSIDFGIFDLGRNIAKSSKYRSPDRIYYFQYVFWESRERVAVFNEPSPVELTDERFKARLDYVMDRDPLYAREKLPMMERVANLSRTLRSVPLELSPSKLTVVLPRNKGCSRRQN